ncbi:MAG TPA: thiol:disulfide interchange protein DsbA/DsbL [Rhodocyclaceae bacterium]|nr:thiol:disulfide interchange protein DsbA/DsbL [Rhodocyclaceae bacterium]
MRKLIWLVGLVFLAAATAAAAAAPLVEGKQYRVLNPARPVEARDKIEVTEFFWYGCSHCYDLDPILKKWLKTMPKDVTFRRIPAVFPGRDGRPGAWAPLAKVYYALEALGQADRLHGDVFDAVQMDRTDLGNENVAADWMANHGVDRQKFLDTLNSFTVQSKVARSQQLSGLYGFDGVPALFVNGRYALVNGEIGSHEDIIGILDQLIDKARADRGKK